MLQSETMPKLTPVDLPEIPPRTISPRLRNEIVYFAVLPDSPLPEGHYDFDLSQLADILDEGVLRLVSPLDTANMTEVELSEEQEELLTWLCDHKIEHLRID